MTDDRNFVMVVPCIHCGESFEIKVRYEDFLEYRSPNRRHIQDIFPYLSPGERELLISNTCDKCWNKMFGDFD